MDTVTGLTKALVDLNLESDTAVQIADKFFAYKYFCVSIGMATVVVILVPAIIVLYKIAKPIVNKMIENCDC